MVEITFDDQQWGATPKMFDTEEAAQNEANELKIKYPSLLGCRVITRRIAENKNKKIFIPEKYGMVVCPNCDGQRYIQRSKRQRCPDCGGFGFIKKESEQNKNISPTEK